MASIQGTPSEASLGEDYFHTPETLHDHWYFEVSLFYSNDLIRDTKLPNFLKIVRKNKITLDTLYKAKQPYNQYLNVSMFILNVFLHYKFINLGM